MLTTREKMVADLLAELRREARARGDRRPVRLVETHISWVLLGPEAYKIKKPVRFPFVDFTGFEDRERACRTEVQINRRLATRTYLGVVPIRKLGTTHSFGSGGAIVEWAVKMNRLDERQEAGQLVERGELDPSHLAALADHLASFHAGSASTPRIARYGAPESIARNVLQNFEALRSAPDLPALVSAEAIDEVERWQIACLRGRRERFERRMLDGRIRDGHGDLRLEHLFFREGGIEIIDAIEFDESYRCGDVCSDVAFLAMDLGRAGRVDLAEAFIAAYARTTNDFDLYGVLDFYESYRACVRAKIAAAANPSEARRYLLLAQSARRRSVLDPMLVAVGGSIASGKSTLATALGDEMSAPVVDADRTRKSLLGLAPTDHASAGAFSGAYSRGHTERVYDEVLRRAAVVLESGRPVVLDASFRGAAARLAARALAEKHNVPFRFLECRAPLETCRERLRARAQATSVSDATLEILDTFAASFEPVTELPPTEHFVVDTSGSGDDALRRAEEIVAAWPRGLTQ